MGPKEITSNIYQVGGARVSHPYDSAVYLLNCGELVLIDSGLGPGFDRMVLNIEKLQLDPQKISTVILTHCHMDHIGGAALFREHFGSKLVMHVLDAEVVERGDNRLTAAFCFNIQFQPLKIDRKLSGEEIRLTFGKQEVVCLHTPGHSAGSMSIYLDRNGQRILFAQDIMAPLLEDFDCDPAAWRRSVNTLLALEADILCDGHTGAWQPAEAVTKYLLYALQNHEDR